MAVRGITFDKQKMKSGDHALEVNYYYSGNMGVMKGMAVTEDVNGDLVVADGYALACGRLFASMGDTTVTVPEVTSGTLYSILVFEIDLTKTNTTSVFEQGDFKVISDAGGYPTLTQQDLTDGGTLHQTELARFENSIGGISNLTDTRSMLSLGQYANAEDLQDLVDEYADSEVTISFTMWASWSSGNDISYTYALPSGFTNGTYVVVGCLGQSSADSQWYNLLKPGYFYDNKPGAITALSNSIADFVSQPCKILLRKL